MKIINLDSPVNADLKVMAHTLNHSAFVDVIDILAKTFGRSEVSWLTYRYFCQCLRFFLPFLYYVRVNVMVNEHLTT
jgi:hypothetical protein